MQVAPSGVSAPNAVIVKASSPGYTPAMQVAPGGASAPDPDAVKTTEKDAAFSLGYTPAMHVAPSGARVPDANKKKTTSTANPAEPEGVICLRMASKGPKTCSNECYSITSQRTTKEDNDFHCILSEIYALCIIFLQMIEYIFLRLNTLFSGLFTLNSNHFKACGTSKHLV